MLTASRAAALAFALLSIVAVAGWAWRRGRPNGPQHGVRSAALPPDAGAVAASNNAFTWALHSKLSASGGNLFYSPCGIGSALAMTYGGAQGETAAQMAAALRFALPAERLHPAWGALTRELNASGKRGEEVPFQLVVANALWLQQGHLFREEFKALVARDYGAGLNLLDFAGAMDASCRAINAWAEEQTSGRITDVIPAGGLDPFTRMVLTNAVYFKSNWETPFSKWVTRDEPFFAARDRQVSVPMMRADVRADYVAVGGLAAVELPYRGGELGMLLLVPERKDGLAQVEKALTAAAFAKWTEGLRPRRVDLAMPRFRTSSQFSARAALQKLGMVDAFAADIADFKAMGEGDLFLGDVVHKAYVAVDEEGTEAAAVTAVAPRAAAMEEKPERAVVVRADRPFLFVIRHRPSGAILFVGRIVEPEE